MNSVPTAIVAIDGHLGTLALDVSVRLINCSASGCLLQSTARLEVGALGSLHLVVHGDDLADHVRVVRCRAIEGGSAFYIGVQFVGPDDASTSLRKAIARGLVKAGDAAR